MALPLQKIVLMRWEKKVVWSLFPVFVLMNLEEKPCDPYYYCSIDDKGILQGVITFSLFFFLLLFSSPSIPLFQSWNLQPTETSFSLCSLFSCIRHPVSWLHVLRGKRVFITYCVFLSWCLVMLWLKFSNIIYVVSFALIVFVCVCMWVWVWTYMCACYE